MKRTFTDKIIDKVLSYIPDGRVKVEAALRGEKKGKSTSVEIKKQPKIFEAKTLQDWKDAIAIATDAENPSLLFIDELYQHLLLDAHLVSVIESRIFRVLRSKYVLLNANGEEVPELKPLFERPFFEQFLKAALMSLFTGVKVIELFELDENLELIKATVIPMSHINPKKGLILKEPGDDNGTPYREGALSRFFIQVGENNDLGILADLAPLILAKKLAKGSWLDFIEKFGIPARYVITDNMTVDRQDELLQMMLDMVSNHVAVIQGNEKIEIGDTPDTDAYKVFDEFIKRVNSEISKRILGQDGTSDNKDASGTYGSLKILAEVANDRHESDKLFAQYIINKILIPKLLLISSFYSPLNGVTFSWDESEEMSNTEYIDRAISLMGAGFELDTDIIGQRSGMPITGFKQTALGEPGPPKPNPSVTERSRSKKKS
jgi:hypothetical protein